VQPLEKLMADFVRIVPVVLLNMTTLYGCIFEQRDKISVREEEVGDEKSTS
jgi:hypothetical protein